MSSKSKRYNFRRRPRQLVNLMPQCEICCDLDPEELDKRYLKRGLIALTQLYAAASAGCAACALLRDGIQGFDLAGIYFFAIEIMPADQLVLHVEGTPFSYHLEFFTGKDAPSVWPAIGPGRNISYDSSSEECMDLAVQWIADCTERHEHCQRPGSTPLPARVILVGSEGIQPSLYVTRGEHDRYAALSHCWGRDKPPLQTTNDTLKHRTSGISFEEFPKTFQDAIIITRRIGLKYLWIDSLCIIQDSQSDWVTEAAKMVTVYQNAYVTIAADAASNSYEGCFLGGAHRRNRDLQLSCAGSHEQTTTVFVRRRLGYRSAGDGLAHGSSHNALSKRAWALQERIMGPRILHYTADELVWECATQLNCECQTSPEETVDCQFKRLIMSRYGVPDSKQACLQWYWEKVVEQYTTRELTLASDRLPALSGLAAAVQKVTSDTYICGLWRRSIEYGLLWSITACDGKESRRQDGYYAPSWSWASVTGQVQYCKPWEMSKSVSEHLHVLEVRCEQAGANPYGPARDGSIKLQSLLCEVRLRQARGSSSKVFQLMSVNHSGLCSSAFSPDVASTDGYEVLVGGSYFFLITASDYTHESSGLVLQKSECHPETYTRVGYMRSNPSFEDWSEVGCIQTITIV